MGADEAGTAKALREHRAAIDPLLAGRGGRIVKTTGDGLLVEFPSIVAAVECAVAVQKLMIERNADVPEDRRMLFRIGINLGDVLIEGEDILGDGVNVAARLEAIAEPGGICISEDAYRHVRDKLNVVFDDAGEQQLKNIARPVRTYRVCLDGSPAQAKPALPLPDKPSIAVLPFQNMSGDPDQEYFADGMVEEITTALSRFRQLFVIARNSSFTYKSRAVDVKQVSRELGVRYVLEGSVRRGANRLRITAQLIDASTGAHLWAERFDGSPEDVFDLQDQVTSKVVGAIAPKVEKAEIERTKQRPTSELRAYDYFLRAVACADRLDVNSNEAAISLYAKAIELDQDFALAYARAAICYTFRKLNRWMHDSEKESVEAARLARTALNLERDDPLVLANCGMVLAYILGDLDDGAALAERALALNPNLAAAWAHSSWMKTCLGEHDDAVERALRATRLSPLDPRIFVWHFFIGFAHFFAERYADASFWVAKALQDQPNHAAALRTLAASEAFAGRMDAAAKAIARLRQLDPTLRVSNLDQVLPPFRRPQDRERFVEGLRKAGLPE